MGKRTVDVVRLHGQLHGLETMFDCFRDYVLHPNGHCCPEIRRSLDANLAGSRPMMPAASPMSWSLQDRQRTRQKERNVIQEKRTGKVVAEVIEMRTWSPTVMTGAKRGKRGLKI